MSRIHSRRSGFALPVAVFAIVIIGALVAGAFFASTQEFRIGSNTIQQTRALGAAEFGLNQTQAN
jgi:Tfp pilus assembly protein PilX